MSDKNKRIVQHCLFSDEPQSCPHYHAGCIHARQHYSKKLNGSCIIIPDGNSIRTGYTADFKLNAVEKANEVGNREAARFFNVDESNIRLWRRNKKLRKLR
ncbi:hypothetical protein TNCV_3114081 [Trichonephila clavipes]|nr:hypothetical protein TNCV_3114081 [Trichonephila clavipes]